MTTSNLQVFEVGGSDVPVVTVPNVHATMVSGPLLAVQVDQTPGLTFVKLGPSGVTVSQEATDPYELDVLSSNDWGFAADPRGLWVLCDRGALLTGGTLADPAARKALNAGNVLSLAGSATGIVAVSTPTGTGVYDLAAPGKPLIAAAPLASPQVGISAAGTVLAATSGRRYWRQGLGDLSLLAIPDMAVIHEWTEPPTLRDWTLATTGDRIARVEEPAARHITDAQGAAVWDDVGSLGPIRFSPSATRFTADSRIYEGATLKAAVSGEPICWLDDERLLTALWDWVDRPGRLKEVRIYRADGIDLGPLGLPLESALGCEWAPHGWQLFVTVTPDLVYAPCGNRLFDPVSGAVLWSGPVRGYGAVAAGWAVYLRDGYVIAEKY